MLLSFVSSILKKCNNLTECNGNVNLVTSLARAIILCISRYISISQAATLPSIYRRHFVYVRFPAARRRDVVACISQWRNLRVVLFSLLKRRLIMRAKIIIRLINR